MGLIARVRIHYFVKVALGIDSSFWIYELHLKVRFNGAAATLGNVRTARLKDGGESMLHIVRSYRGCTPYWLMTEAFANHCQ